MKEDKRKFLAKVAYLYYEKEMTQSQIAMELNMDRTTVSRMLKQGKKAGIVQIKIAGFDSKIFALELWLKEKYQLKHLEIVPTDVADSEQEKEEKLAKAASFFLKKIMENGLVVGVAWGATIGRMIQEIENKRLNDTIFVPIVGGPSQINSRYHVNTLVYEMARKFQGKSIFINATVVQETKEVRDAIFGAAYFQELKDYWSKLDLAIVGIGGLLSYQESQWRDLLIESDYQELKLREAVGDSCCCFFDSEGKVLKGDLTGRTIGLDLEQLGRIPCVLGVARGKKKSRAILAMLKKGYINALVTDEETIRTVIALENE